MAPPRTAGRGPRRVCARAGRRARLRPGAQQPGLAFLDEGKATEAIAEFEQATRLRPDLAAPFYNLGNALVALDRWREAEPYYERALQIDPEFAQAHNNLANLYAYRGNLASAIEHYEKALALEPALRQARENLNAVRAQQHGAPTR